MRVITSDRVIRTFGVHDAVAKVSSGDSFWVELRDCYDGQVQSEADLRSSLDASRFMPCTGPIAVDGALPGQTLRVDILAIEVAARGAMALHPSAGLLGSQVAEEQTRAPAIDASRGVVHLGPLTIALRPMIGSIGTAPQGIYVPTSHPGPHGGNLDAREVAPGASLYLPVFVPGALLALGDLHAAMGDGELCGLGVEVAGRALLRVTLLPQTIHHPRVETPDAWITFGSAPTLEEALRIASTEMADYLCQTYRVGFDLAYRLLSTVCHAGIASVVNPLMTAKVTLPKTAICAAVSQP